MYKGKDELQIYLETVCHVQAWAKKQIAKNKEQVKQINTNSISNVKQTLKK